MPDNEAAVRKLHEKIDDYRLTVGAITAFGHVIIRYYSGTFRMGKKLQPSPANRVQAKKPVTPDVLAQGSDVKIIGEVKKGFPKDRNRWLQDLKQVEKYDDELKGWPDGDIKDHDLILFVHYPRAQALVDYTQEQIQKGTVTFNRKLAIVEYNRDSESSTFWTLKRIWGDITNSILSERLRQVITINADEIVEELSSLWFYDSEPELPYTMSVIWDKVFSEKATLEAYRKARGRKTLELSFTVDEILEKLRLYFSYKDSSFPSRDWVEHAMDAFVKFGRADKTAVGYTVYYHRVEIDLLDYFIREWIERSVDVRELIDKMAKQTDESSS
ncbi:hypothetical protein Ngar_c22710 [Candidatus Nitrososphaera gargensis Ga9.2]|uniref:Uncharacterized protein n=1 Tax=Nitrososphaera gargensis (strain Ga9.2) TaxID=1237085 RepID=K0ICW6_NITGG|nr:hypothetical protein [Candidatus Nitrososphaera gargensis]AFU59201.1 hypothetical protein Ngar_c22710 [Candidatus Nitrososphaera gargensis Ga9.2]